MLFSVVLYGKTINIRLSAVKIDQKTLQDLAIFHPSGGLFEKINLCTTLGGTAVLKKYITTPPADFESLKSLQTAVRYWSEHAEKWCEQVNNGTMLMVDKFFTATDAVAQKPSGLSLMIDKLVRNIIPGHEQSLFKFAITQVMTFVKGCADLVAQHLKADTAVYLQQLLQELQHYLAIERVQSLVQTPSDASYKTLLTLSYYTRKELKNTLFSMVAIFEQLDALRAMGMASHQHHWTFPELLPATASTFEAIELYHPLLENPIPYSLHFHPEQNFMFLTGANMSGKSTLIRSLGICAYLAHIGMAVPAKEVRISYLDTIISNMQIEDNIYKGESYFFAEVQRIKKTAQQIVQTPYNLVLMDELFKGTNVHDAYECAQAVIQALVKSKTNIMALSTHLYELGQQFEEQSNIQFKYCETTLGADQHFHFTYQLKEGVSNDRIGYIVLQKEGVLDLLGKMRQ